MELVERQARTKHRVGVESPAVSRDSSRVSQVHSSTSDSASRLNNLRHPSRDHIRNSLRDSVRDPVRDAARASRASSQEPSRNTSRDGPSTQEPKKKTHSELLQSAIEHNRQLNVTRSRSSQNLKHIPMIVGQLPPVIPGGNLVSSAWPHVMAEPSDMNKKGMVSPLMVLKDQYNTRRPNEVASEEANKSLQAERLQNPDDILTEDTIHASAMPPCDAKHAPPDTAGPNFFNRMTQIMNLAQNSVNTLVRGDTGEFGSAKASPTTPPGNISNFHSESDEGPDDSSDDDDDDDTREEPQDTQYKLEPNKPDLDSLQDIMNEINDFQSEFVDKFATPDIEPKRNRTQQKILDYKSLYALELPETAPKPHGTEAIYSHEIKIQHDTISSQYTAIRLRFSQGSRAHSGGILGYMQRTKVVPETKKSKSWGKSNDMALAFSPGSRDLQLRRIWDSEMSVFGLEPPELEETDKDIYNGVSLSDLARSVKLH